jgi:oxygen-dependent protoporphyrinogen oxidase
MAAWHLQCLEHEVDVWEASPAVGGWAQTLPWPGPAGEPGFLERGPEGFRLGRDSALDHLMQALDVTMLPASPRGPRWLGKGGRRQPSPTSLAGLLKAPELDLGDLLRLLAEPFIPAGTDAEESLQAFFARRLGAGFARELLPGLVAGFLAAPPERISLAALPRLRQLEAQGGLLLGGLRAGPELTRRPEGGVGALALSLAAALECVCTNRAARTLEALPGGRWRVHGDGISVEAGAVVVALPSRAAAEVLRSVAPAAAAMLAAIPRLDLRVWHSRHLMVPGWERGFGLLIHPPEGHGLLGAVSLAAEDPRSLAGLLQVRTYLGGAYPMAPALESWPGVLNELRRWLPELPEPVQVREEPCPGAFPLLEPGHGLRVAQLLAGLPPNLHWVGTERFGPGVPDLAEGIEAWASHLEW